MVVELWAVLTAVGGPVAEVLKTGAENLVGLRVADEMQAVRARMAGHLPLPENHDLVRGVRAAHLAAVRKVALRHGRALDDLPKGEAHGGEATLRAALLAWLDERQRLLHKDALDHEQVTGETVRHVLDEMVHPSAAEGFAEAARAGRAGAEARALAEIADACGAPPDLFRRIFTGGEAAGWYDHFALFVNEELKVNVRFRAIGSKRLSELSERRWRNLRRSASPNNGRRPRTTLETHYSALANARAALTG